MHWATSNPTAYPQDVVRPVYDRSIFKLHGRDVHRWHWLPSMAATGGEAIIGTSLLRLAAASLLFIASLGVGGYGVLYLAAISTSDSSTGSLAEVGILLIVAAAALIAFGVWLLRGVGRSRSSE